MKKINLALAALMASIAMATTATANQKTQSDYSLLDLNFAAPIVFGDPLPTNSRVGSMIYEMSTNTFRGLFADGNWRTISQGFIAPTVKRFTSGSGTYTPSNGVLYIVVEMVGAGGGGAGGGVYSGGTEGGAGTDGGDTVFGSSLLNAGGGKGALGGVASGGAGGSATVDSGVTSIVFLTGGSGGPSDVVSSSGVASPYPSVGASSYYGGAGTNNKSSSAGTSAVVNSGSGGGGGTLFTNAAPSMQSGASGGAGAFIRVLINNLSSSYSYSVGTGGNGGAAGTNGGNGGAGGSGIIIVTEYYQ